MKLPKNAAPAKVAEPPKTSERVNKSAFIRSLPRSMPVKEVVKAARQKGITVSDTFVHSVRHNAKKGAAVRGGPTQSSAETSGPSSRANQRTGRSPKVSSSVRSKGLATSSGLVAAIERIVEEKVTAFLRERLGGRLG